jgi:hypothetical protein
VRRIVMAYALHIPRALGGINFQAGSAECRKDLLEG